MGASIPGISVFLLTDKTMGDVKTLYVWDKELGRSLEIRAIEYFLTLKVLDMKMLDGNNAQFEYDYFYAKSTDYSEDEQRFLTGIYENVVQYFLKRYLGEKVFILSVDIKPLIRREKLKLGFQPAGWVISVVQPRLMAQLNVAPLLREKPKKKPNQP